jgi:hypothetical protein
MPINMKNPMISLIIVTMLFTIQATAQPGNGRPNRDKMKAQRIAFITNKLALTPDEAKAFWPIYDEYDQKRQEIVKSFRHNRQAGPENPDQLTDKEAMELADNQIIEAQKLLDLRKEYHIKFKQVLPAKKILQLYDSEREFQKMLIDRLRDKPGAGPREGQGKQFRNP